MIRNREPKPILLSGVQFSERERRRALATTVVADPLFSVSVRCRACRGVCGQEDRFCGQCGTRLESR